MRRSRGELEEEVLRIVSSSPVPLAVADVVASLPDRLAHTTVMTALVRLTEKRLLERTRNGRRFEYSMPHPIDSLPALRAASRMRAALDGRVQRADVLANFVASLDPSDEAVLRKLLAESGSPEDRGDTE